MSNQYTQLRIWRTTLNKLRMIYATTGESMISIVDRIADQELKKLKDEGSQDIQVQDVREPLGREKE